VVAWARGQSVVVSDVSQLQLGTGVSTMMVERA
jgi:hypothetical protein